MAKSALKSSISTSAPDRLPGVTKVFKRVRFDIGDDHGISEDPTITKRFSEACVPLSRAKRESKLSRRQRQREREQNDMEITSGLENIAHLAQGLDTLLAEMGRQTVSTQPGQRSDLNLNAKIVRTVEVKLPKGREDGEESAMQVDCRLDPTFSKSLGDGTGRQHKEAELAHAFDVYVTETMRQCVNGPYRQQSNQKTIHRLRVTTDSNSIFISFLANKPCPVQFVARLLHGKEQPSSSAQQQQKLQAAEAEAKSDDGEEGDGKPALMSASVGQKLECKLRQLRSEMTPLRTPSSRPNERLDRAPMAEKGGDGNSVAGAASSSSKSQQPRGGRHPPGSLFIFKDRKPGTELNESQKRDAIKLVLSMWLGPRFTKVRRAKGTWIKILSADCPRKLIKFLRKLDQDRHNLTSVAIVGAFEFMLKRQRELHLMRAQMALRQLIWYKALFAASRLRYAMVIVAKSRKGILGQEVLVAPRSIRHRDTENWGTGSSSIVLGARHDSMIQMPQSNPSVIDEVRKFVAIFGRYYGMARSPRGPPAVLVSGTDRSPNGADTTQIVARTDRNLESIATVDLEGMEDRMLEQYLAARGFTLRPQHDECAYGGSAVLPGGQPRRRRLSQRTRRKTIQKELGESFGRQVQFDMASPQLPSNEMLAAAYPFTSDEEALVDLDAMREEVAVEVNDRLMLVTAEPEDLRKLAMGAGRIENLGMSGFHKLQKQTCNFATELIVQRRIEQAELEGGNRPVAITKRYTLTFFDDRTEEFAWLPLMQSLLLLIGDRKEFRTNYERTIFEKKIRDWNQVRKAASRKPGLQTIEAAMWSHPMVVHLAARLQRAVCKNDSVTAWKSTLFEGCYKDSSDRDPNPPSHEYLITRGAGGAASPMLRRLADVSGAFLHGTGVDISPPGVELTPYQPVTLATTTCSGHPVRSLGDRAGLQLERDMVTRFIDRIHEVDPDCEPKDLRLEALMKRRRAQLEKTPREGYPLMAHTDRVAQSRYEDWAMRSDVPERAKNMKAQWLTYFDKFTVPACGAACNPERQGLQGAASSSKNGASANARSSSSSSARSGALAGGGAFTKVPAGAHRPESCPGSSSRAAGSSGAAMAASFGIHLPDPSEVLALVAADDRKALAGVASALAIDVQSATRGHSSDASKGGDAVSSRAGTAPRAGSSGKGIPGEPVRVTGAVAGASALRSGSGGSAPGSARGGAPVAGGALEFPSTIEDIERLVMQFNVPEATSFPDHGNNLAHRCASGWDSGYRREPMSQDEIRRSLQLERAMATRGGGSGMPPGRTRAVSGSLSAR